MARVPKPWYDSEKKAWYIRRNGKRVRLGKTKKEADRVFYQLMAKGDAPVIRGQVGEVIDHFLDWILANRAKRTYEWYHERIGRWLKSKPPATVAQLKPHHVQKWLDTNQEWSDGYKRGCITALKRVFNFAVKQGYIDFNPIKGLEKPEAEVREQLVSEDIYKKILDHTDQRFGDLITFLWETGARPQEARQARPKHFKDGTITFPANEAPKGNKKRIIYLNDTALEVVQRNLFTDPIFVNRDGNPWTAYSINCRFDRMRELLGEKYCAYAFRHTYGYRAWTSGKIPPEEIAKLMGHSSTEMLYRIYGHIEQNPAYMREAANRLKGVG